MVPAQNIGVEYFLTRYSDQSDQTVISRARYSEQSDRTVIPTPPESPLQHAKIPVYVDENTSLTISISTRFFPGANLFNQPENLTLQSDDSVFFYVCSAAILQSSFNQFGSLIPAMLRENEIIHVPESSTILNIILHAVYGISVAEHVPPLSVLVSALHTFPIYGLDPKVFVQASKPLHSALLSFAPLYPIEVYALAGSFGLEDLAVSTSSHLLAFQLSSLTDEMAARIGAVYLNRLIRLHLYRVEELKAMLLVPPQPHLDTPTCTLKEQQKLGRAWMLVAAYLVLDARPNVSTDTLSATFGSLLNDMTCVACMEGLRKRVSDIIVRWSLLRVTI